MQATATRLLTRFNQGELASVTVTTSGGGNEWDAPTTSAVSATVSGVVKGVSSRYSDGSSILMSDLQVTLQADVVTITPESQLTIDGKSAQVLRVDKVPAAGVTVAYQVFVRV